MPGKGAENPKNIFAPSAFSAVKDFMKLRIRIPATTANLGPGFDCLGLALDWWNTIEVEPIERGLKVECDSPPGVDIPLNRHNLVVYGRDALFRLAGKKRPPALTHR